MSYNGSMPKQYTATFKAKVVTELLKEEKSLAQLAAETGVSTKQLSRWRDWTLVELPRLFDPATDQQQAKYEQKITELYAEIGRLTTELSWLKKKVGRFEPD